MPPCTAPDTVLGSGTVQPDGAFEVMLTQPLERSDCIYAVCSGLTGPISALQCVLPIAPAPALSQRALATAVGVLGLVAFLALIRRRRGAFEP